MADSSKSKWIVETADATFEADVIARSAEVLVVVDFWAEWCQPCRMLTPILEQLVDEFDGKFVLVKAETEKAQAAASSCGVQGIPAVYAFRDGQLVDFFAGLLPEDQLRAWLERLLPSDAELRAAEAKGLEASDPAAAEVKYDEAIAMDANLAIAKIGLARLLQQQGRTADSRAVVDQLERRGFLEPDAEKLKAELDVRAKADEAGSVDQCRTAVDAAPEDNELKLKLSEALAADGQYQEALDIALELVQQHKQEFGEPAKQIMVDIFQLLPDDSDLISTYRRKLSAALY